MPTGTTSQTLAASPTRDQESHTSTSRLAVSAAVMAAVARKTGASGPRIRTVTTSRSSSAAAEIPRDARGKVERAEPEGHGERPESRVPRHAADHEVVVGLHGPRRRQAMRDDAHPVRLEA